MAIKLRALIWLLLAGLIASCLLVMQNNNSINIDSDILSLLPGTGSDPAVELAFDSFSEQSMRRIVLLVKNADRNSSVQDAEELAQALRASPWISTVSLRQSADRQGDIGRFFFDHRHHLLSEADEQLLLNGNVDAFTDDVIRLAYAPLGTGLIELVQSDPFLLSWRIGNARAAASEQALQLDDGYLVGRSESSFHTLITAELVQNPFSQELQYALLTDIDAVETHWRDSANGSSLIRTGALFHTAHAYETARYEVSLIGGCSLLLIFLLLLLTFRSGWPLILVVIALGFGVAAGFAAVRFIFGGVHLLTLVFGASLIGVAEDYAFHYFVIDNASSSKSRLAKILPALTIGLLTSVLGYLALLLTPFPGIQQMAVFCISGLTAAWLTVVLLFPLTSLRNTNSPLLLNIATRFLALCTTRPARLTFYAALSLPLMLPLLLLLHQGSSEDVRNFQAQNEELLVQEQFIGQVLDMPASNQFFLVKGDSAQEVLDALEQAQPQLDALQQAGAISGYLSIADQVPGVSRQQRNYGLYRELYASDADENLISAGLITREQFDAARDAFAAGQESYASVEAFLKNALGQEYAYLWLTPQTSALAAVDSHETTGADPTAAPLWATIVPLRGVARLDLLSDAEMLNSKQVFFVDKISTVNQLLVIYRANLGKLLALAGVCIFGLLCFRYGLRKAAMIIASPLIAVSATVLGLTLAGEALNLFSVLALFLVVGIGIDFGIFFAEDSKFDARTLLAVMLSGLTTLLSFGLLSLSATSAIHSFGLSTLIGISTALILSPIIGGLIRPIVAPAHAQRMAGNEP